MSDASRQTVSLRRARIADSERLLDWRNDPETRRWYIQPDRVPRRHHQAWLARKLADRNCRIYIAESRSAAVGQLRLERAGRAAEVSLSVDGAARGRGMGALMLRRAVTAARREFHATRLVAYVRPENVASAIAFLKAGYRFTKLVRRGAVRAYMLERTIA
jgi:RimJ/RimL family protein N-acetyltransferase